MSLSETEQQKINDYIDSASSTNFITITPVSLSLYLHWLSEIEKLSPKKISKWKGKMKNTNGAHVNVIYSNLFFRRSTDKVVVIPNTMTNDLLLTKRTKKLGITKISTDSDDFESETLQMIESNYTGNHTRNHTQNVSARIYGRHM